MARLEEPVERPTREEFIAAIRDLAGDPLLTAQQCLEWVQARTPPPIAVPRPPSADPAEPIYHDFSFRELHGVLLAQELGQKDASNPAREGYRPDPEILQELRERGLQTDASDVGALTRELGKVRHLPPILRNKLPADADPEGQVYWHGQEPHLELRIREPEYELRAQEAAQLLAGAADAATTGSVP